jgi:hypothetical protein
MRERGLQLQRLQRLTAQRRYRHQRWLGLRNLPGLKELVVRVDLLESFFNTLNVDGVIQVHSRVLLLVLRRKVGLLEPRYVAHAIFLPQYLLLRFLMRIAELPHGRIIRILDMSLPKLIA